MVHAIKLSEFFLDQIEKKNAKELFTEEFLEDISKINNFALMQKLFYDNEVGDIYDSLIADIGDVYVEKK